MLLFVLLVLIRVSIERGRCPFDLGRLGEPAFYIYKDGVCLVSG
uniref:Uncharacterized protein n=1 Tax=Setaria viridis TaxID=4556 RepID=A0A4U6VQ55_SETVI|nr:hypothetical protein SEVIR_2G095950v2 [Setaria viridis]